MKQFAILLCLAVGVAFGQTTVMTWHTNVEVWLPFGATHLEEEACQEVFKAYELPVEPPIACYGWSEEEGQYVVLTGSFLSRGYRLVAETVLDDGAELEFSDGQTLEVARFVFKDDGRVQVLAYRKQ